MPKVVTYNDSCGHSIDLDKKQIALFERSGVWPKGPTGNAFSNVEHGLHESLLVDDYVVVERTDHPRVAVLRSEASQIANEDPSARIIG